MTTRAGARTGGCPPGSPSGGSRSEGYIWDICPSFAECLDTGEPIGGGMAFARDICHILDSLACYIGWLFPLWDARRQTFADKIISTVVVPE